ncbi:MAG: DUF378 domain-containing protein [Armatimonadia bacterium]
MRTLNAIVLTLVIIGALNWGLVGAFNFNLVSAILGTGTLAARIVYLVVGLAGLYSLSLYPRVVRLWHEARVAPMTPQPVTTG